MFDTIYCEIMSQNEEIKFKIQCSSSRMGERQDSEAAGAAGRIRLICLQGQKDISFVLRLKFKVHNFTNKHI